MILEILAVYGLIQCTTVLAQLIGRRHDVLYYVSKPDTH